MGERDLFKVINRRENAVGVVARERNNGAHMGTMSQYHRVILLTQLREGYVFADFNTKMSFCTQHAQVAELEINHMARQTVLRNTNSQHAAVYIQFI